MTMQHPFSDITYLKEQVRYILPRLRAVSEGSTIRVTGIGNGIVPVSKGGTGSQYGALWVAGLFANNTGADLNNGDVVVLDPSLDRAINVTTSVADQYTLGIVKGSGPFIDGAETPVEVIGYHAAIRVEDAVIAGHYLRTSATSGSAEDMGALPGLGSFAVALTAFAGPGSGTVTGYVFPVFFATSGGGGDDVFTIGMAIAL